MTAVWAQSGESIDVIDSWSLTSLLLTVASIDEDDQDAIVTLELRRPEVERLIEQLTAWLARGEV